MSLLIRVETTVTLGVGDHYIKQMAAIEMDEESLRAYLMDRQLMLDDLVEGHIETAYNELIDKAGDAVWAGIRDNLEGVVAVDVKVARRMRK